MATWQEPGGESAPQSSERGGTHAGTPRSRVPRSAPPPGAPPIGYLTPGGRGTTPKTNGDGGPTRGGSSADGRKPTRPRRRVDERSLWEIAREGIDGLWLEIQDPDRRRLVTGIAAAIAVMLAVGAYYYFAKLPESLADDYRVRAQPAADRVADSMDEVYAAFDNYLAESDIPPRKMRNAEDFDEYRRRALPAVNDMEDALQRAEAAMAAARGVIAQTQPELGRLPSELFLGATGPIGDIEDAAALGTEYTASAAAYLADFERYLDYERKGVELARKVLRDAPSVTRLESADLDELRDALAADLRDLRRLRRSVVRIEPPPDLERSHDVAIESVTVDVDFFDDMLSAVESLNQYAYVDAVEDYVRARYRVERQEDRAEQAFEANSGLQDESIRLTETANELEASIARLGSGSADEIKPRSRKRPAAPPPTHPRAGEGESQKV